MTASIRRIVTTTTLAATLATGAIVPAAPALAGWNGQIGLNVAPSTAEQDRWMRAGLEIYSLVNDLDSGSITQRGSRNAAGMAQNGRDNRGVIHQDGNGHEGSLAQNGDGNAYGLFQFGEGTRAQRRQEGHGGTGLGLIFGW